MSLKPFLLLTVVLTLAGWTMLESLKPWMPNCRDIVIGFCVNRP